MSEIKYVAFDDYPFNVVPLSSLDPKWNGNDKKLAFVGFKWGEWQKTKYPEKSNDRNCIVICGQYDKDVLPLYVIDLDLDDTGKFDIKQFLKQFQNDFGFPPTRIAKTPSGGYHLYYLLSKEIKKELIQGKKFNKYIFKGLRGIDLLCRGAFVVCPPTKWTEGETMGEYKWYNSDELAILDISIVKKFINVIKIVDDSEINSFQIAAGIITSEIKTVKIKKGGRNNFVFALAGFLKFYEFPQSMALEIVNECPVYVDISTENQLNYIADVYQRSPSFIEFKEELNVVCPGLTDRVGNILFAKSNFHNYVRFRLSERGGHTTYLVHDTEGIYEYTSKWNKETESLIMIDKTIISPYCIDRLILRKDPITSQIRHIAHMKRGNNTRIISTWFNSDLKNKIGDQLPSTNDKRFRSDISIILDELVISQRAEISEKETNYGLTLEKGKIIFLNNMDDIAYNLTGKYEEDKVREVLEFIKYAASNLDYPVHFSSMMKFIFAAPLNWCKILGGHRKRHILLRGEIDSGKTFFTDFSQSIYDAPSFFSGSGASANTEARLSNLFDHSTFINVIEEANDLWTNKKGGFIPNAMIKASDKCKVIRTIRKTDQSPLSQFNRATFMFTQNQHLTIPRSLMKRIIVLVFDSSAYQPKTKSHKEFERKYREIMPIAKHLGNCLMDLIPKIITIEDLSDDLFVIGKKILNAVFGQMGVSIPEWADLEPMVHEDYDNIEIKLRDEEAIRKFIIEKLKKAMKGNYPRHEENYENFKYYDILEILDRKKQMPANIEITAPYQNNRSIILDNAFIEEMNSEMNIEISGLRLLSEKIPNAKTDVRRKKRVTIINVDKFTNWLDDIDVDYQSTITEE